MGANYFAPGDWNAICDQCGRKFKASQLLLQWDNARVCSTCWDPRHPQDFVRPIDDPQAVPWSRPETINFEIFTTNRVLDGNILNTQTLG